MPNKQKRWRRAAHAVKLALIREGRHTRGARYGKAIRAQAQIMSVIKHVPSNLFQRLAIRAGVIQGETA